MHTRTRTLVNNDRREPHKPETTETVPPAEARIRDRRLYRIPTRNQNLELQSDYESNIYTKTRARMEEYLYFRIQCCVLQNFKNCVMSKLDQTILEIMAKRELIRELE